MGVGQRVPPVRRAMGRRQSNQARDCVKSRSFVKASLKGWAHLGMSSHRCAASR
jgi:hypothetical protein